MESRSETVERDATMKPSSLYLEKPFPKSLAEYGYTEIIGDVGGTTDQIATPIEYPPPRKNKYYATFQNHTDRMNVPEILYSRQLIGNSWKRPSSNRQQLQIVSSTNDLSSRIAW